MLGISTELENREANITFAYCKDPISTEKWFLGVGKYQDEDKEENKSSEIADSTTCYNISGESKVPKKQPLPFLVMHLTDW